jgi:hypothetical protein
MATSRTRLLPVPDASIEQCEKEAIAELSTAGGTGLPSGWEKLESQSWAKAKPEPVEVELEAVPALVIAAAGYVVKPLIRWFVGKVDKKLQEELEEYTAVYRGAADFQLYRRGSQGPRLAHTCFRLSRLVERDGSEVVAFDLLAQLRIIDREVLKIRPLRLFVGETVAKTKDDYLGIAVSLKADAVWREDRETHRRAGALTVEELLTRRVETGSGKLPLYVTFWSDKSEQDDILWSSFPSQPLPPWSRYDGVSYGGSHLALDIAVAEVGNVPWLLEKVADLVHAKRDDIVSLLEKAAERALEPDKN